MAVSWACGRQCSSVRSKEPEVSATSPRHPPLVGLPDRGRPIVPATQIDREKGGYHVTALPNMTDDVEVGGPRPVEPIHGSPHHSSWTEIPGPWRGTSPHPFTMLGQAATSNSDRPWYAPSQSTPLTGRSSLWGTPRPTSSLSRLSVPQVSRSLVMPLCTLRTEDSKGGKG
jgi:hypothetical protein